MKRRMLLLLLSLWLPASMAAEHAPPHVEPKVEYHGLGRINRVEPVIGLVNITHDEVPFAGWGPMTRDLRVRPRELTQGLMPGTIVRFQLTAVDPLSYVITALEPVE